MKKLVLPFAAGIFISGMVALAHHSLSGIYDTGKQVKIEGTVARFQFINPHPFLTIDVNQDASKAQSWELEMDNRSELVQVGMSEQTFKRGDRVVVTGSPGRSKPNTLYINRLDRPSDGFRYEQIGTSPKISTVR